MYQYAILDPRPSGTNANDTILTGAPVVVASRVRITGVLDTAPLGGEG